MKTFVNDKYPSEAEIQKVTRTWIAAAYPAPSPSPITQEDISTKIDNLNAKMDDVLQTISNTTLNNVINIDRHSSMNLI